MIKNILMTLTLAFFTFTGQALAADPIYTKSNDLAVGGYDSVSYFQGSGEPVKGSDQFKTEYKGAHWLFASADNQATFEANPEKYAPQYGGYCAWAAAHGVTAKGDPEVYYIEDGKLYLNINEKIQSKWIPRRAELIEKGDAKFPGLVSEPKAIKAPKVKGEKRMPKSFGNG